MYKMGIYWHCVIILIYVNKQICLADFSCLCNYAVETPVHTHYEDGLLGYMYEYDCKELLPSNTHDNWTLIAFEHKVGYVKTDGAETAVQLCQGEPYPDDILLTTTTSSSISTKNGVNSKPATVKHATGLTTSSPNSTILTVLTTSPGSPSSTEKHTLASETTLTSNVGMLTSKVHEIPNSLENSTSSPFLSEHTEQMTSGVVPMDSLSTAYKDERTTTMSPAQLISTLRNTNGSSINTNIVMNETTVPVPHTVRSDNTTYSQTSESLPKGVTTTKASLNTKYIVTESTNMTTVKVSTEANITDFLANKTTSSKPSSMTGIFSNATNDTTSKYPLSAVHTNRIQSTLPSVSADTVSTPYSTKRLTKQTVVSVNQTTYFPQTSEPSLSTSQPLPSTNQPHPPTSQPSYNKTDGPISGRTDLCPYHVLAMTNYTKATGYLYMRQLGQYCYELRPYLSDWATARKDCIARSGDMVVVDTPNIHELLLQMLKHLTFVHDVWIGLHDIGKTGTWKWTNGKSLTSSDYKAWMSGNMDAIYGHLQECVKMDGLSGQWKLAVCNGYLLDKQRHPWICQYKIS